MDKTNVLNKRKCVLHQSSPLPLKQKEIDTLLNELQNKWRLNEAGHLYKSYTFPHFMAAMDFANHVAKIAEQENHHPELTLSWGKCTVEIWAHKVND